MSCALGFGCLVIIAVTAGAAGLPEQQLETEDQIAHYEKPSLEIQGRNLKCKDIFGKCVKKGKFCPVDLPLEKKPGKPYCKGKRRCCYPESDSNLAAAVQAYIDNYNVGCCILIPPPLCTIMKCCCTDQHDVTSLATAVQQHVNNPTPGCCFLIPPPLCTLMDCCC